MPSLCYKYIQTNVKKKKGVTSIKWKNEAKPAMVGLVVHGGGVRLVMGEVRLRPKARCNPSIFRSKRAYGDRMLFFGGLECPLLANVRIIRVQLFFFFFAHLFFLFLFSFFCFVFCQ